MNLKQLNDKEYLLGISKDVKKLKEACDKDIGILFAKFKHFSIYPDFDILKEIKTVPARLFLLNNYDLDDNQIKEFIKDPYSGFVFLKDNSQFLKNMPAPVVKNPVQYAQSVDIGSFNGEFELGKNFKELSTWLKVFKYNMSKVLDLNSHTKKMIKACFNKLVNETTHIELNQILKLKEVINAENKLLVNVLKAKLKNKKELTPDEHKYVEVFQAFSREKNILEGKDCDLDVAFKKLQKLRELNVDASDPEMLYQEKLIMYMVAGHSKLKEPGKLNELLTKWAGNKPSEIIYFNNIWKVAFDNNYFFNNYMFKSIKERKFDEKSIAHLIENSFELADNITVLIETLKMARNDLYPSSNTSLQNISFAHTYKFLSHLDSFEKYDFPVYDFAKSTNLKKQINENMDNILESDNFENNDDTEYQFKI